MLFIAPYFGYLASLLLIIALLVTTDLKFRWFNTGGNVAFIIYALVLHAIPVLLTNSILLVINVIYLIRVYSRQEDFSLIEFTGEEKLVNKFMHFYQDDIQLYFPGFAAADMKGNLNFVVLRDLVIANIFSARVHENGDASVVLNYTLKKYRDYKIGRFIFDKEKEFLRSRGINRIVYERQVYKKHAKFLQIMGFAKHPQNPGSVLLIKDL